VEQALVSIRKGGTAASMEPRYSAYGDLQGLYDVRSGLTFLFVPNLTEQSAAAVLLHESVHGQQKARIDAKALAMIEGRGKDMLDTAITSSSWVLGAHVWSSAGDTHSSAYLWLYSVRGHAEGAHPAGQRGDRWPGEAIL